MNVVSILFVAGSLVFSLGACGKKAEEKTSTEKASTEKAGTEKADTEAAAPAEDTEQIKGWKAWTAETCKCKDFACVSGMADKRNAMQKEQKIGFGDKAVLAIIEEGRQCMLKVPKLKAPVPQTPATPATP